MLISSRIIVKEKGTLKNYLAIFVWIEKYSEKKLGKH